MTNEKLMREPVTGRFYTLQVFTGSLTKDKPDSMRYALRNRDMLKEAFGEPFYIELVKCLSRHFQSNVANDRHQIEDVSRPVIFVDGLSSRTKHIFVVLGQTYDVVRLAYYKTVTEA